MNEWRQQKYRAKENSGENAKTIEPATNKQNRPLIFLVE
jgi:hypothetical protein